MNSILKVCCSAVLSAGICLSASNTCNAMACYDFVQTGFDEGATVTGWFCGTDLNSDGGIGYYSSVNELTELSLTFSGNSLVPAFTFDLGNLIGSRYDYENGPVLGDVPAPFEGLSAERFVGANRTSPDEAFITTMFAPGVIIYRFEQFSASDNPTIIRNVTRSTDDMLVTVRPAAVPEPSSVLVWTCLIGLCVWARRRSSIRTR